ncbi:SET domain-containing protein [Cercophora scortea]|uniref:SET domain-containing protein n=1 Tax=Cercophora scortea TaxID=314031 RepID=A0AAE0IEY1_9PEZI|nr:SET domain-containing protein [Cercophora scortea]
MADQKPHVSFIGLGAMGFGMATHLVKQGYTVTGFDVWGPTLERFRAAGGLTATKPAEAVAGKDFSVFMVATAQQAQSALFDGPDAALPALPQGAVVLLCSTVPCDYVQSLQKDLISAGRGDILLVDSPVSGGAARAADGTLSIMAGMSDAALDKARPLLAELADPSKLYIVQGGIGAGSNMKMVHQVLAACQILAASEAMGFAEHLGLDLAKTKDAVLASDAWNWMFEHRTPRMLTQFQPVASAILIIMKDTSIITAEARRSGFPSLLTSTAEQVYFTGIGRGFGPDDDSSLIRLYTEGKGKMGPLRGLAETEEAKLALVLDLLKGILLCSAAESLAFANAVGLDLDQVFELCINAAGGSKMLQTFGPEIITAFRDGTAGQGWAVKDGGVDLKEIAEKLRVAVEEGQRLKAPLFLGNQAYNITRLALQSGTEALAAGAVVKYTSWRGPRPRRISRRVRSCLELVFVIQEKTQPKENMEEATRKHFFLHGRPESNALEQRKCHWCQIRSFKTHSTLPISIVNTTGDGEVLNPKFRFIDKSSIWPDVPVAEDSFRVGCDCDDDEDCMYSTCHCLDEMAPDSDEDEDEDEDDNDGGGIGPNAPRPRRKRFAYHSHGVKAGMLRSRILHSREPIYECHDGCSCSLQCPNRVVERGRTVPLQIFRTEDRGWGVRCPVEIKKGQFVDRYLGEIITADEANTRRNESTVARRKDVYLFVLDKFYDPESPDPLLAAPPVEVDGEFMSGPTRFINHSCDPNMRIFARVGDHADKHIHDLALFAIRDIPKSEELTFDYVDGQVELDQGANDPSKMTKCLCGTDKCRGFLW